MSEKLFSKGIAPKCIYCKNGKTTDGGDVILCKKTGIMQPDSSCRKFKYDPLKRKPEMLKIQTDFTAEDFRL